MRTTHTYACLEVSAQTYREIADALRAAGYDHAFNEKGEIDMHGIGLQRKSDEHDWQFYANGTFCRRCGTQIGSGYPCR